MLEASVRRRKFFVGVALDQTVRDACLGAADALREAGFAARYEAPEKLHATLAFLGYAADDRSAALARALQAIAAVSAPIAVPLDKLGAFPHERKPRVVFVGAREQGAAFRSLVAAVRAAYANLGFEFTGDAIAHVTIARVKGGGGRPLPPIEFLPATLEIRTLTLFESLPDPTRRTTRYAALLTVPLEGR
jgi:RNA 2',3'-cyclic 3'-phosphodiesterase